MPLYLPLRPLGFQIKLNLEQRILLFLTAVTLANNRSSISSQEKMGAEATRKSKRQVKISGHSEADRLAAQEAKDIAIQDELDKQFARDFEAVVEARASRKARRQAVVTHTPGGRVTCGKGAVKKTVK
jgi:hypothetical protein